MNGISIQDVISRFRLVVALVFCILFLLSTGCAQKVGWKPPDEPRTTTPPPAEAPPRVEYQLLYVAADKLNLRACPGMDCPRINLLTRNQEVEKVGESQGWYQVRSRQDGTLGWVDARYLASAPVPDNVALPSETVQPKQTKPVEAKPKVKAPASVVEEEEEEQAPRPKRRKTPAAEAAEPPTKPAAEPTQETPAAPSTPATPSESGKKKIRIM
jgi:uncharacterized protein YgiM (DUF1202 family)